MNKAPESIGPYRIEAELGRGGMGVVYRVRHAEHAQPRALKLILTSKATSEELARFAREAETLARVRHPNVIRVHELGRAPEGPYLLTELVEGESLDQRLRGGPLAAEAAAGLVQTLCFAVEALHAVEVLHRDLKPANVMLRAPADDPVLLDFGIAQDQSAERLTETGTLVGTPAYMSPEQAGGETGSFGPATDVYGLGAILYALLNGEPPFPTRGGALATIKAVIFDEPTWPRRAELPSSLVAIASQALAKEPAERYASAAALGEDLARFLHGEGVEARAPVRSRGVALGAVAALCVSLLLSGAWFARLTPSEGLATPSPPGGGLATLSPASSQVQEPAPIGDSELRSELTRALVAAQTRTRPKALRPGLLEQARELVKRSAADRDLLADLLPEVVALGVFSQPTLTITARAGLIGGERRQAWLWGDDPAQILVASAWEDREEKRRLQSQSQALVFAAGEEPARLGRVGVCAGLQFVETGPAAGLWALYERPPRLLRFSPAAPGEAPEAVPVPSAVKRPQALAVDAGGQRFAIGGRSGEVWILDRRGRLLRELQGERRSEIRSLAFLRGSRVVAVGSRETTAEDRDGWRTVQWRDAECRVWDLATGRDLDLRALLPENPDLRGVRAHPDGETFLVTSKGSKALCRIDPRRPSLEYFQPGKSNHRLLPVVGEKAESLTKHPWTPDGVGPRGFLALPSGWYLGYGFIRDPRSKAVRWVSQVRLWDAERVERLRWEVPGQLRHVDLSRGGRFLVTTVLLGDEEREQRIRVEVRQLLP